MRIIAGEFGGRKLLPPPTEATRPITDRAKQSLFDVLTPQLDGALVYDCFAGTGSMGLESLSRGASFARFFSIRSSRNRVSASCRCNSFTSVGSSGAGAAFVSGSGSGFAGALTNGIRRKMQNRRMSTSMSRIVGASRVVSRVDQSVKLPLEDHWSTPVRPS